MIGGDAGGMAAATQARRLRADLDIVALERGNHTSYSACGIPFLVGGEVSRVDDLVARTPQQLREQHRSDILMHHEAMMIDTASGMKKGAPQCSRKVVAMIARTARARSAKPSMPHSRRAETTRLSARGEGVRRNSTLHDPV